MPVVKGQRVRQPFQPSSVKEMTEIEAAWMGALLEGEGTAEVAWYPTRQGSGRYTPRIRASVVNTDPELMSACLRLVGTGSVSPRSPREGSFGKHKQQFVWTLQARNSVLDFFHRVAPYSMKAQDALTRWKFLELKGEI